MLPLITEPSLNLSLQKLPHFEEIKSQMLLLGDMIKQSQITVSSHPDQFVVLGSKRQDVNEKSIKSLNLVGELFDYCKIPQTKQHPINIHPSRSPKSHEEAVEMLDCFVENYFKCSESVQKRFVLENEDKGFWNCENLYKYFCVLCKEKYGFSFSLTYDNLHDEINQSHSNSFFEIFKTTWPNGVIPVFHWSEGKKSGNIRSHADTTSRIPFCDSVIWELEVKHKDKAILELQKQLS